MKRILLLLLCSFSVLSKGLCQLTSSPQQSPLHHIYRLTNEEARTLYLKNKLWDSQYSRQLLHTPVGSFAAGKPFPDTLPPGHYLEVYAVQSRVKYEYHVVENIHYKLLNTSSNQAMMLYDRQGRIITDAAVRLGNRPVAFDAATQTYPLGYPKRKRILEITHDNLLTLVDLNKSNNYRYRTSFFRRLFARWRQRTRYYSPQYTASERHYTGFVVTNKPKFKPLDTVRLKAFIRTSKGQLVNKPVWLRISDHSRETDTIIAMLTPYRPGAFEYTFVLSDSLDLTLDDRYDLTLEARPTIAGEDDDDDYIGRKRKVMVRNTFQYEEYELNTVTFKARTDYTRHTRGTPVAIYFKATDENQLPVPDGRVQIRIEKSETVATFKQTVFIPDTLWQQEVPLEPAGETKVLLPDSIFPAASIDYKIHCRFLSASNESRTETLLQHFTYPQEEIRFAQQGDSMEINHLIGGKPFPAKGRLALLNANEDTLQQIPVSLPAKIALHPFAKTYVVTTDKTSGTHTPSSTDIITGTAIRTRDSVFIQIANACHTPFWYAIYGGRKIVRQGYHRDNFEWKTRATTLRDYTISIQYIRNDQVVPYSLTAGYAEKLLQVAIQAPVTVFPGQTSNISVRVKDADGKPVKDADVTSYAATSKFRDFNLPFVPYGGKNHRVKMRFTRYEDAKRGIANGSTLYDRAQWEKLLSLDTSVYYQFLQPKGFSILTEPVTGQLTQLAPFITINGLPQQIVYLWIDGKPAYLQDVDYKPAYSFPVTPGYHQLRIRTAVKLITMDSVLVAAGRKTFLNINIADPQPHVQVKTVSRIFSRAEKEALRPYLGRFYIDLAGRNFSYIQQNTRLLSANIQWKTKVSAWPLEPGPATFTFKDLFNATFTPAPERIIFLANGEGSPTLQQSIAPEKFNQIHVNSPYELPLYATLFTPQILDSLWQEHKEKTRQQYLMGSKESASPPGTNSLQFKPDTSFKKETIKQLFLYRYQDPSFYRVNPAYDFNFKRLDSGWYRLLVLRSRNYYQLIDSIYIYPGGTTIRQLNGPLRLLPPDTVSQELAEEIWQYVANNVSHVDGGMFSKTFYQQYMDQSFLQKSITGTIRDEQGNPVPGATVMLKHTDVGTVTGADGSFRLNVTQYGILVVSAIGYIRQEISLSDEQIFLVKLIPAKQALEEVVVTAMGMQTTKRNLTGSVSGVMIRGMNNATTSSPLIIKDGVIYEGTLESIDPATIGTVTTLKDEVAKSLYGARAANGVILIQSATGNSISTGKGLRQHFRDDAFWQPRLRTDEKGEASFNVTFPDDITNWKAFAIAMTDSKQSGTATAYIKAYQPLAANLALPNFVVAGDTLQALGKILNYTTDTVTLERRFFAGDKLLLQGTARVQNSHLDTVMIVAPQQGDSLSLKYTIQRDNFMDGERRVIPIFPQGVMESNGTFLALRADTSFTLPTADTGDTKVYIAGSLLPVMADEIDRLKRYTYNCNEQMASKVVALLLDKQLCIYEQRTFHGEKQLQQLLRKLTGNQYLGGWGWWNKQEPVYWISQHVTRALLMAEKAGYSTSLNKQALIDYQRFLLASTARKQDKIAIVDILQQLGAKMDYRRCLDTLPAANSYEQTLKLYILQRAGDNVSTAALLQRRQYSLMGNPYWGDDSGYFPTNDIQQTLLVYKLLRQQQGQEATLAGIRDWLMEQRRPGYWRNTYESATILETILPDLLQNTGAPATTLTLNGRVVRQFPYDTVIRAAQPLQIHKQGNSTVYFTASRDHWNPIPEAVSGKFTVTSSLVLNGQPQPRLIAGTPVDLRIDVNVVADADYVMIEIPIPAGCSYNAKPQSYEHGEVHREHFKQQVSIFSHHLTKGKHSFTVSLMPRYSGVYHLNPAKASMMYFPVLFGRTRMKQVIITGK
ncbi:alpha-2-macroglobulin family protein [Chitinophaga qingshengii]|uniref:Carboxypeptidase-like regulatory domain-containing protein n=1 Tax=Chitinophaga qingshengii TaxID=1569794 RepID=A0ABR7TXW2_9BACT|nr:alpha-2-macroglobulin family protein [Chitinophaga qingshengii]MBC9934304.1 carboxypeptidase-like regulatory domain-containing protein [Chitinophaga qingshengii]